MANKLSRAITKVKWFLKNIRSINADSLLQPRWFGGYYPLTYNTDGLATCNNCDFIQEPLFAKAYQTAVDTKPWEGFTLQWRTYIVCWFANMVKGLEGDFVECGVNTGAYSRAVIEYVDFQKLNKTFFLLDTYEGLVPSMLNKEEIESGLDVYLTYYKDVYEGVKKTFAPFNTKIIKGPVPGTLTECTASKICYLSIDMNCVEPEIAAAEYFWDKVVKGGVIILDDYGFPMHIHQKLAFDKFAKDKNAEILCLPTGQGIIIKK